MSDEQPKRNANGDIFPAVEMPMDDSVAQRLLRMREEARAFQAEVLAPMSAARKALGRVDYVAIGRQVIEVQPLPLVVRAAVQQHAAEVAAASMAEELVRQAMPGQGDGQTPEERLAAVTLEQPGYFWFREEHAGKEEYVVRWIVGDGAGTLWFDDRGHGVRVTPEMRARCCGRVWTPDEVQALSDREKELARQLDCACTRCVCSECQYDTGEDAALRMRVKARREALADHVHMVWARWMAWQGEHVELIPATARGAEGTKRFKHNAEVVRRWMRQAQTPYAQLTEEEKASDRAIADEYLAIVLGKCAVDGAGR